jgi:hypothetical protein
MKPFRILAMYAILLAGASAATAQTSNAIIFTENGERFTAILNGLRQNQQPETNVKVEGLNANFYKLKVIFENAALGEKNFNMSIDPGTETTYVIKKNNKNEYVLRPMSMVPIAEAPQSTSAAVVTYDPNAAPYTGETVVTQQTTTTTTTGGTPAGGVSMGVNVNDAGGTFSMNVSGFEGSGSTVTSQQTTTVTTTTTSTAPPPPAPTGSVGCQVPMGSGDFGSMKSSISSKSFEDSKVTIAKQILNDNCLSAAQVRELMNLFTYEESKLDIAKYAYRRTVDPNNYYKVNDAFTFETSIDDLNAYINANRR